MRYNVYVALLATVLSLVATICSASTDVAFSYQGRVKVQGEAFNGQGQFKLAIVNTSGDTVLWSHDGTGMPDGVPASHFMLPVEDGIFNVLVGDTTLGMAAINSTIFNSDTPLKLRVWFNDGVRGFQQLNPDHNLVNLALTTIQSSQQDFTIYVNGSSGNDKNNGLTPSTAKKTIQAAVDTLPERIRCNVTIDVADGTYQESVKFFGITVEPGKTVALVGDTAWTGAGTPAVRLTGSGNSGPNSVGKEHGIIAVQCSGIQARGFAIDNYTVAAVQFDNGIYEIADCKITSSTLGILTTDCSTTCTRVEVSNCAGDGIQIARQSAARIRNCSSTNNSGSGLTLNGGATANMQGTGNFSGNTAHGYKIQHHSAIVFSGDSPRYSGTVSNNKMFGMSLSYLSYSENHTVNTFSLNRLGPIETIYGGLTTY